MSPHTQTPPRSQRTTAAAVISIEAASMAFLSNMPEEAAWGWWDTLLFPSVAGLLAVVTAFGGLSWNPDLRTYRRVLAGIGIACLAKYLLFPHTYRFFALFLFSALAHASAQFLLAWQVFELTRQHRGGRLPAWFIAQGALVMICVADVQVTGRQREVFEFLTAGWALAGAACLGAGHARPHPLPTGRGTRLAVSLAILATAGLMAVTGSRLLFHITRNFEGLLRLDDAPAPGSRWHSQLTQRRLGNVPAWQRGDDLAIAIRAYSPSEPGYLKVRAFDRFARSTWNASPNTGRLGQLASPPAALADSLKPWPIFRTRVDQDRGDRTALFAKSQRITLWPARRLSTRIPRPRGLLAVQLEAAEVAVSADGVLVADQLPAGHPCRLILSDQVASAQLPPPRGERLLSLPDDLPDVARELAGALFASCETDLQRIHAVQQHFQDHYDYSLGIKVPPDRDPLEWFLADRPEAHCEFFATGTAVLLRLGGVPCRYVTGFVATEYNEFGRHWVARNKDAHAWVEAYDRQRGWVIVEATPSSGRPQPVNAEEVNPWWESIQGDVQRRRAEFDADGWLVVLNITLDAVATIPGMLVLVGGGVLVARWVGLRWRRRKKLTRGSRRDPLARQRARVLARMDATIARDALVRAPHETLHQFATRLGAHPAANWYRRFAVALYTGSLDTRLLKWLDANRPPRQRLPLQPLQTTP